MRWAKTAGLVLIAATAMSCVTFQVGTIQPNVSATNEIVMSPELKTLLRANPRPKIVIRIPNPPSNVTEADRFNSYINVIEKTFVQKGFAVRDRALLENLMRSGNPDYRSIKEKTDTDLIIDILALNFDGKVAVRTFFNKTTQKEESFATAQTYVDCAVVALECRVTIVDRGQLGGLFTLRTSPADLYEYSFYVDGFRQKMAWVDQASSGMFPVISLTIFQEATRLQLTQTLTENLIGLLSGTER